MKPNELKLRLPQLKDTKFVTQTRKILHPIQEVKEEVTNESIHKIELQYTINDLENPKTQLELQVYELDEIEDVPDIRMFEKSFKESSSSRW